MIHRFNFHTVTMPRTNIYHQSVWFISASREPADQFSPSYLRKRLLLYQPINRDLPNRRVLWLFQSPDHIHIATYSQLMRDVYIFEEREIIITQIYASYKWIESVMVWIKYSKNNYLRDIRLAYTERNYFITSCV